MIQIEEYEKGEAYDRAKRSGVHQYNTEKVCVYSDYGIHRQDGCLYVHYLVDGKYDWTNRYTCYKRPSTDLWTIRPTSGAKEDYFWYERECEMANIKPYAEYRDLQKALADYIAINMAFHKRYNDYYAEL